MNLTASQQADYDTLLPFFDANEMPYPEHERMDFGAMRVHVYRGAEDFSVLYEMLMFSREDHRILRYHGFNNFFFVYGRMNGDFGKFGWGDFEDAVTRPEGEPSVAITAHTEEFIEDRVQRQALNPDAKAVLIRGERVEIPTDPKVYLEHQIEVSDPIQLRDVLRYLIATHRDAMFSTEAERQKLLPNQTLILTLDEWNHFAFDGDVYEFYETEAVQMLCKVAVTGDASHYAPTKPPNTHWSQR